MPSTLITAGQCLLDVALQELGSLDALFDLADANGLGVTDALAPGLVLLVPASAAAQPLVAAYFGSQGKRINLGGPIPVRIVAYRADFDRADFNSADFRTALAIY